MILEMSQDRIASGIYTDWAARLIGDGVATLEHKGGGWDFYYFKVSALSHIDKDSETYVTVDLSEDDLAEVLARTQSSDVSAASKKMRDVIAEAGVKLRYDPYA